VLAIAALLTAAALAATAQAARFHPTASGHPSMGSRTVAARALSARPEVLNVDASPQVVRGSGGTVLVSAQVRGATRCSFSGQRRLRGVLVVGRTVGCASGHASVRMAVAANPYGSASTLRFVVVARDGAGRTDRWEVHVIQSATPTTTKPTAPALTVTAAALPGATVGTAYSQTLAASGGAPPYIWALASGALPPGLTLASNGQIAGTPTQAGSFSFGVRVTDSAADAASAVLMLTVAAPNVPIYTSPNWSGYVLAGGGPYTGVTGTFNVPQIYAASNDSDTAEWVGIGGWWPGDNSIIQAGIDEQYVASINTYYVVPWVELFPAPAYRLPILVNPGDSITVGMQQTGIGQWSWAVKDNTNGQSYGTSSSYNGELMSADWVVEAPSSAVSGGTIFTLGNFSPVTFTQLGVNPVAGGLSRVVMVQNGQQVATPSPLTTNGFTVGPGGVTPAAP
jgi:hypothetical protein